MTGDIETALKHWNQYKQPAEDMLDAATEALAAAYAIQPDLIQKRDRLDRELVSMHDRLARPQPRKMVHAMRAANAACAVSWDVFIGQLRDAWTKYQSLGIARALRNLADGLERGETDGEKKEQWHAYLEVALAAPLQIFALSSGTLAVATIAVAHLDACSALIPDTESTLSARKVLRRLAGSLARDVMSTVVVGTASMEELYRLATEWEEPPPIVADGVIEQMDRMDLLMEGLLAAQSRLTIAQRAMDLALEQFYDSVATIEPLLMKSGVSSR